MEGLLRSVWLRCGFGCISRGLFGRGLDSRGGGGYRLLVFFFFLVFGGLGFFCLEFGEVVKKKFVFIRVPFIYAI